MIVRLYAKMAWDLLSPAHHVILAQTDRDKIINRPVETMKDVYTFVRQSEPLKKTNNRGRLLPL